MLEVASLLDAVIAKGERSYVSMPLDELITEHKRIAKELKGLAQGRPEIQREYEDQLGELQGFIARRKKGAAIAKSLSFDPTRPVEMNAEQNYYNPYRQLGDGSYAPHAPGYWMEQAAGAMPDGEFGFGQRRQAFDEDDHSRALRRDGYREVDQFMRQAGVVKAMLDIEIDEMLEKGFGVSPAKPKPALQHHEKIALVRQHLKKRKGKEKIDREKALDKKIKEHIDATLADHFETHRIKQKVHATMQKRLGTMGPQQRATLHQTASGLGRPAMPEETAWSGMEPRTKAKKPTPSSGF